MTRKDFLMHRVFPVAIAGVVILVVAFDVLRHLPRPMETLYPGLERAASIDYGELSLMTRSGQRTTYFAAQAEEVEQLWEAISTGKIRYDGYDRGGDIAPFLYMVGFVWKNSDGEVAHASVLMDGHGYAYGPNNRKFHIIQGEEALLQIVDAFLAHEEDKGVHSSGP